MKYDLIASFHHKDDNILPERIRYLKPFIDEYKCKKTVEQNQKLWKNFKCVILAVHQITFFH